MRFIFYRLSVQVFRDVSSSWCSLSIDPFLLSGTLILYTDVSFGFDFSFVNL